MYNSAKNTGERGTTMSVLLNTCFSYLLPFKNKSQRNFAYYFFIIINVLNSSIQLYKNNKYNTIQLHTNKYNNQ